MGKTMESVLARIAQPLLWVIVDDTGEVIKSYSHRHEWIRYVYRPKESGCISLQEGMDGEEITAPGPFEHYPGHFRRLFASDCEKVYRIMREFRKKRS